MSDKEQQKDSAANNADQSPPPQDIVGEKIGEAVRVPTLTQPPSRRSAASTDDKDPAKKKKEKRTHRTPSTDKKQEKGPSGQKPPLKKRSDRTPSRDKKAPKLAKGPSGPKTPPGEPPADATPGSTKAPSKGSSEPTSTPKNPSGFRIPKIKDARPVRDLKEEAAARQREKNFSEKNYAKATAVPHYELGSHPLNPEETEEWDVTPIVKRGGLVSSYVALGRNAEHYKPKPKGSSDPTSQQQQKGSSDPTSQTQQKGSSDPASQKQQSESSDSTSQATSKGPSGPTRKASDSQTSHKRGRSSSYASSDHSSDAHSRQEKRDRLKRGERSRQQSPYGQSTSHRSRADAATGPSGLLKTPQQTHSRSRSQERKTAQLSAAQKQKELNIVSKMLDAAAADHAQNKGAKKPCVSKPAADYSYQPGKIVLRFDQEPSGSNAPIPTVKRSLRKERKQPYTPVVDANIRKDNIIQTRDEFKRKGKPSPVDFRWYGSKFCDATSNYELEFAIAQFVDPASVVPLALLPVHTGNIPPTIQECAKEEELYPNEFIRGNISGTHPAIAFQAIHQVRSVLKGHLASSDVPKYPSVGIYSGLDYDSAASAAYPPWQDNHRMWQEQTKALEHFARMALDLLKTGIRRPLCLMLRNKKTSVYKAIPDALEILDMLHVPNTFPFLLTNWSGSPEDAWTWLRKYPNTIFGITYDFVTTKTDRSNVQFLRELPLSNMVLESGSPKIRCDKQYATSATCIDIAKLLAQKTGENHRYILEQTAWTGLKFFFPQATRPHMWTSSPQMDANQASIRFDSVGEKLLELDMQAAQQGAPSGARRAGGLPSMTAEELRKRTAAEQLNHTNKSILDQVPAGESANVFEELMMDFSPNTESFQEMEVRRERANSGQGHMAAPSIDVATEQRQREPSGSKNDQRTSPPPLDYESDAASAAQHKAEVLTKAKDLASRVVFPRGETFADKKAKAQRIKAAIDKDKRDESRGFKRRPDDVVLDYPEFDDSYWDVENCPRPFPLAEPVNTGRWSIMIPNPKRTYFEPLDDCRDHDVDNNPHLRIEEAIPSYRIICKEKGGRRPAEASTIGRLHVSSYGKMYLILWASRHHIRPREDPTTQPQRANLVVLEFINTVARHRSYELPRILDDYFDRIREGCTDDPFTNYDFKTAIMRWYDSCPNASAFFDGHATGPIHYNPQFLQNCRRDIADAYHRASLAFFREAMDWCRMRHYQVQMGFQRKWTHARDLPRTLKNNIVRVNVNTENILQQEQVLFIDSWGEQFAHNLRPNVQTVRLSDLHSEAIEAARKFFMGHMVRKVYWFHGASAFKLRTSGYIRTVTDVSEHFTRTFPYVRFYHVLAPFTDQQGRAWHDQLHAAVERVRSTSLNTTLIMHPTDLELCGYYDECQLMHLDNAPWPTDEHTPDGHLSEEGLRRRKEFMEVHYAVELWNQREHDEQEDREEAEAAQELVGELEQLGEFTRLPQDDAASEPADQDLEELEEPSGSLPPEEEESVDMEEPSGSPALHIDENTDMDEPSGSPPRNTAEDPDLVEPSGSNQPDKAAYVPYWSATAQVTPTEPSIELREFYNRTFNTTTGRKPHRYDHLSQTTREPPKPTSKFSLEGFLKKAAIDAKARKVSSAEYSAGPSNKESTSAEYSAKDRHQAGKSPSRPSTTDTTSDLSDAPLPLKLPIDGLELTTQLLEKFRHKFDTSTPERAALYDQLIARANELTDDFEGSLVEHFIDSMKVLQRFVSSDTAQKRDTDNTSSLAERLQLYSIAPQPSTSNQETHQVSSDTNDQVASNATEYQSINESAIEDEDGSLIETDEESQRTDNEEEQSHEDELF